MARTKNPSFPAIYERRERRPPTAYTQRNREKIRKAGQEMQAEVDKSLEQIPLLNTDVEEGDFEAGGVEEEQYTRDEGMGNDKEDSDEDNGESERSGEESDKEEGSDKDGDKEGDKDGDAEGEEESDKEGDA